MRWLADSLYNQLEAEWTEAYPDTVLQEDDVPFTAVAEADDEAAAEEHGPQPAHSPISHHFGAVQWQPRLGEILEDSEESLSPADGEAPGRPSVEKNDPRRKQSVLSTSSQDDSSTDLELEKSPTVVTRHASIPGRHASIAGPSGRRTSITGTTHWAPQSIHYRVRTRSGIGSLSGASVFSPEVEVESISDKVKVSLADAPSLPQLLTPIGSCSKTYCCHNYFSKPA